MAMLRKTLLLSAKQLASVSTTRMSRTAFQAFSLPNIRKYAFKYSSALTGSLDKSLHLRGGMGLRLASTQAKKGACSDQAIRELFENADVDGSGTLSYKEMRILVESCFARFDEKNTHLSEADFKVLEEFFDLDQDGRISVNEVELSIREWFPKDEGKKALLIIDLQNDFITGSLPVRGGKEVVDAVNNLRDKYDFDVIAHTRDWHPKDHVSFQDVHNAPLFSVIKVKSPAGDEIDQVMWPRHCVADTEGAQFHPDLRVDTTDLIVNKGVDPAIDSYSGFFDNGKGAETELRVLLRERNVTEVFCVGVAWDFCVGSTALDAVSCGFKANLVQDCTREVGKESKENMQRRLNDAGVRMLMSKDIVMGMASNYVQTTAGAIERAKMLIERRKLVAPEHDVVQSAMQNWNKA